MKSLIIIHLNPKRNTKRVIHWTNTIHQSKQTRLSLYSSQYMIDKQNPERELLYLIVAHQKKQFKIISKKVIHAKMRVQ